MMPGLTHCVSGPVHALGRRTGVVLDPLPETFAYLPVLGERATDIAPAAALGRQTKGRLARVAFDAWHFIVSSIE